MILHKSEKLPQMRQNLLLLEAFHEQIDGLVTGFKFASHSLKTFKYANDDREVFEFEISI